MGYVSDHLTPAVRWLDDEEAAAWRNWLLLAARVRSAVGRDMARDHSMSEPEYAVLVNLSEAPDHRLRMTELAARLDWSKSRLSHLVGRMEARGSVSRIDCPQDGRSSFAALTGHGLDELTRAAPDHVASVRRHFLALFERDQLQQLSGLTGSALQRLEAAAGPCSAPDDGCGTPLELCTGTPGSDEGCPERD